MDSVRGQAVPAGTALGKKEDGVFAVLLVMHQLCSAAKLSAPPR